MKNLILAFLTMLLLVSFTYGQGIVGVKSYNLGTVANSVDERYITETFDGLLKQFNCNAIDSIVISATVVGEADIDSLDFYPCNWTSTGTKVLGAVVHHTVTLNVAAAGTGTEVLYNSNHGVQAVSYRGYEGFAILTRGAASGNDATDPNNLKVTLTFFGS